MTSLQIAVIAVTALLALAACWAILVPLFSKDEATKDEEASLTDLLFERDRVYQALEDLEHDFLSEKISEEDYNTIKKDLLARAAQCATDIDSIRKESGTQ